MRNAYWPLIALCQITLCLTALGLLASRAAAREIYLAGDDKSAGLHTGTTGDATGSVRTIAKALRLAQAGDRIVLAANEQPYREYISLVGGRHSGAAPLIPFMIDGNGATLDGTTPIPDDEWTFYRDNIFRFRPPELSQAVLFYHGRSIAALPLSRETAYPPRLAPTQWCVLEGAIYFAVDRDKLPRDYKLSYAAMQTGITLYQVQGVVIRNLTIRGFQADGVSAAVGSREILLDNITCTANGQSGVCVRGGAQVAINACKIFGNVESQLFTLPNSETHIFASELMNDTARGWLDQGGKTYLGSKRIEGGKKEIKPE